jgi:hypothetical protein
MIDSSRKVFGIVIVLFSDFGKVNIGLLSFLSVTVILTVAVLVNGGEPRLVIGDPLHIIQQEN